MGRSRTRPRSPEAAPPLLRTRPCPALPVLPRRNALCLCRSPLSLSDTLRFISAPVLLLVLVVQSVAPQLLPLVLHPSTLQPRLHSRAQPSQHYRLPPHALHVTRTRTRMRTDTNLPPVTPLPSPVSRSSRPFSPATSPPAAPAAPSVPLARQFSFWPFTHTLIGSHGRPDNPLPSPPSRASRLRHPFLASLCSSVRAL